MKKKLLVVPIFLMAVVIIILILNIFGAGRSTYGVNDKVSIIAGVTSDGSYQYVEIQVNSVSVMEDKIEGLNTEPFGDIPEKFGVSEDGTISSDYSFVAVNLTISSDVDIEVCVSGFQLEAGNSTAECYYNSAPVSSGKSSGYTYVSAGVDKEVTIGFFVDSDMLKASSFTLRPVALSTEEKSVKITIDNPTR